MYKEVKEKILTKIGAALDNPISAETLGVIGNIVAKFEENEIIRNKKLDLSDVKNDLMEIVEAIPMEKKSNKKEVL